MNSLTCVSKLLMCPSFRCLNARCSNLLVSCLCHPNFAAKILVFIIATSSNHGRRQTQENHVPAPLCSAPLFSMLIVRASRSSFHRYRSHHLHCRPRPSSSFQAPQSLDRCCDGAGSRYWIIDALVYEEGDAGYAPGRAAALGELITSMCQQIHHCKWIRTA